MQNASNVHRFILIEDNEIDLFFHEKLLSLKGLASSVDRFSSAAKALKFISSFKNRVEDYPCSIILLDIQMPEMDGFEFLKHFEDLPEKLLEKNRIFMVSSSLDYADISRSKANYLVDHILEKPLDVEKLKEAIRQSGCPEDNY